MTMHNHAEVGEISERIVLVGDPNRAKYIAEHYLEDAVLVNDVRCAYCYTGGSTGICDGSRNGRTVHADLCHGALQGLWL